MTPTRHAIDWFEIPVSDMDRAAAFYEALLATTIRRERIEPHTLGVIKYDASAVGGCLIQGDDVPAPSTAGTLIYLNAGPSLDVVLSRANELGAKVLLPKLELPRDIGFIAQIVDCEGNRIGLHSPAA